MYTQQVQDFISSKPKIAWQKKILVIYGPTGAGKTAMSIDIAKQLDTEIISTDSRQIFQYMDIGTGKITKEEMQWVPHHMIDIITPDTEFSVGEFKNRAVPIIDRLYSDWKIPVLCWGTGLYIDSLIYDFNIPKVPADENLRKQLEQEAEEQGKEYIFEKLQKLDPEYDRALHPNNLRYVIRALEVKLLTGKSKTTFKEEKVLKYDTLFLTPYTGDRAWLYHRIDTRVQGMFDGGLVDEVRGLLQNWYSKTDFGMQSIGYEEVIEYLEGKITLDEAMALVQKNSRNYAKRQLTWFRRYAD